MRRSLLLIALLLLPALAAAQPLSDNLSEFYSYGDRYYVEVITAPGATTAKARTIFPFRLSYDLMTFRKAPSRRDVEIYVATPEMYVEAVGSDGVIADRALWRDTISVNSFSATNAKDRMIPGVVEMSLRPGMYRFRYTLADEGPGSGLTEETPAVRVDDFGSPSPAIGMPLFLRAINNDTLVAGAIGAAARFGERLRMYVPLASSVSDGTLRYDLFAVPKTEAKSESGPYRNLQSGLAQMLPGRTLGAATVSGEDIRFVLTASAASPVRASGALIDARIDNLEPGDYLMLLSYTAGPGSVVDSVRFRLRWVDQPVSLYRASYSIRALYPIATDAGIDSLMSGSPANQSAALDRFWDERDPTPGTEYNEAMAEYYRRVDYAFFNFRSISQKDGVFTDRGKIYILYGPPTDVNRQMSPDSHPREIWTYRLNRGGQVLMNRQFVFLDESKTGAYRLVEYHDL